MQSGSNGPDFFVSMQIARSRERYDRNGFSCLGDSAFEQEEEDVDGETFAASALYVADRDRPLPAALTSIRGDSLLASRLTSKTRILRC